jgi:hypothetical protein
MQSRGGVHNNEGDASSNEVTRLTSEVQVDRVQPVQPRDDDILFQISQRVCGPRYIDHQTLWLGGEQV